MKRGILLFGMWLAAAHAHDIITTPITFGREISRILYARCNSCHHEGGAAFSLMTYNEARPWAEAIKEEVLARRMPPWGAIKGFGDFRNDQALTPEQVELVESWADGGVPEGEPKDLPPAPKFSEPTAAAREHGEIVVGSDFKLASAFTLGGLRPEKLPEKADAQITAELPDGSVEPLVWLQDYKPQFAHAFLLRTPLELPAGTTIRGVPPDGTIVFMPPEPPPPAEPASLAEKR
jgi:hypothetical protein